MGIGELESFSFSSLVISFPIPPIPMVFRYSLPFRMLSIDQGHSHLIAAENYIPLYESIYINFKFFNWKFWIHYCYHQVNLTWSFKIFTLLRSELSSLKHGWIDAAKSDVYHDLFVQTSQSQINISSN